MTNINITASLFHKYIKYIQYQHYDITTYISIYGLYESLYLKPTFNLRLQVLVNDTLIENNQYSVHGKLT